MTTVAAGDVTVGMTLYQVDGETVRPRRWPLRRRQPTVIDVSYLEDGEGGRPTVYIESSEMRGWTWCLTPTTPVVVGLDRER
jgi:hypothetical protein